MALLNTISRLLLAAWLAVAVPVCLCGTERGADDHGCCDRCDEGTSDAYHEERAADAEHAPPAREPCKGACRCEQPLFVKAEHPRISTAVETLMPPFSCGVGLPWLRPAAMLWSATPGGVAVAKPVTSLLRQHCALIV